MAFYGKLRKYPVGSVVQHRDHYVYVKVEGKEWKSQHRWMAEMQGDATGRSGELKEGEKVYHLNGRKDDNDPKNLIRIQFDTTRYYLKPLKTSVPIYVPTKDEKHAFTNEILALARKREKDRIAA